MDWEVCPCIGEKSRVTKYSPDLPAAVKLALPPTFDLRRAQERRRTSPKQHTAPQFFIRYDSHDNVGSSGRVADP